MEHGRTTERREDILPTPRLDMSDHGSAGAILLQHEVALVGSVIRIGPELRSVPVIMPHALLENANDPIHVSLAWVIMIDEEAIVNCSDVFIRVSLEGELGVDSFPRMLPLLLKSPDIVVTQIQTIPHACSYKDGIDNDV